MTLKKREKVLLLLAFVAIALLAFDRFYYTPQTRRISNLEEEVKGAEQKLNESLPLVKGIESLEAEVTRLERLLETSKRRMPGGEGLKAFLSHMAKETNRLQMKVISLVPQEEKGGGIGEKEIPPNPYKKIHIQMVAHSGFSALESYLRAISELPFPITITNLQVEKEDKIDPFLKATLQVTVYERAL
jgi:Tfp pilus assembly protein PilO